jgi:hypothetical protein
MRVSTKLGIAGLIIWGALQLVAAAIAPPEGPADPLALVYAMAKREAVISVQLLSIASLLTGIGALIYAGYRRIRPQSCADGTSATSTSAIATGPGRWTITRNAELPLLLVVIAVLFAVNFATAEIYPMAWVDEMGYADPAVNLARGNGLTSSVWYNVYWGKLWFAYPPLYQFLLAPWVAWFGVNLTAIRLFNVTLISATAVALWHYTVRSGLFPSMLGRAMVVLLPLLGYGISFSYRSARPDTLCVLLAALALYASLLPDPRWRAAALIAIGALVPWAGVQLAVFAIIVAVLIGFWWLREAITVFRPLGVGMGLGLIALLGFYVANGSLYGFLASTFGAVHTITGEIAQIVLLHDPRSLFHIEQLPSLLLPAVLEDRSSVFLATAAILLLAALRRSRNAIAFKVSCLAVAAALAIPIVVTIAGRYWLYYTWMGCLAIGIPLVISVETAPRSPALLPARRLAIGCIVLALVVGLPVQLARAYMDRNARDYDALRAYVRARVAPGDWVLVAPPAYFAVAELGAIPASVGYATGRLAPKIPDDQNQRIKLMIVRPDEVKTQIDRLGGSWIPSGSAFSPPRATRLTWAEGADSYQLVAYRRE